MCRCGFISYKMLFSSAHQLLVHMSHLHIFIVVIIIGIVDIFVCVKYIYTLHALQKYSKIVYKILYIINNYNNQQLHCSISIHTNYKYTNIQFLQKQNNCQSLHTLCWMNLTIFLNLLTWRPGPISRCLLACICSNLSLLFRSSKDLRWLRRKPSLFPPFSPTCSPPPSPPPSSTAPASAHSSLPSIGEVAWDRFTWEKWSHSPQPIYRHC